MRLLVVLCSASILFFAIYLGTSDHLQLPNVGMTQLCLWLTPLLVALASLVTLLRIKDDAGAEDKDKKQFTVLRGGKGRPRVLENASTTWGGFVRSLGTLAPYLWPKASLQTESFLA